MSYAIEFKEKVICYFLENPMLSTTTVSKKFKIPRKTLGIWIREQKGFHMSLKNRSNKEKNWPNNDKFKAVLLYESLSNSEQGEFLREHGLYSSQIKDWKDLMLKGLSSKDNDCKEIKRLKDKLEGKDAIIELQKKTQKFINNEGEK